MQLNNEDLRKIFDVYDINQNGQIAFEELKNLFLDLSYDKLYEKYHDPEGAFYHFLSIQWDLHDKNGKGTISYEDFLDVYANLSKKY